MLSLVHVVVSVSYMSIYVPIVMYGLRLFYKRYIVYQQFLHADAHISQSFVSQLYLVFERHELKLKNDNNNNDNEKMKNYECELLEF